MNPVRKACTHKIIAKGYANDDEVSIALLLQNMNAHNDIGYEARRQYSRVQSLGWPTALSVPRRAFILQWGY